MVYRQRGVLLVSVVVALSCVRTSCQEYVCTIGPNTTEYNHVYQHATTSTTTTGNTNTTLLLDLNSPSTCNASINTWSICYVSNNGYFDSSGNISVGVWRRNDSTDFYELVNESLSPLPLLQGSLEYQFDFICQRFIVQSFDVMEGDIVGVVITNVTSVSLLNEDEDGMVCMVSITDDEEYQTLDESAFKNCSKGYHLAVVGFESDVSYTTGSDSISTTPESTNSTTTGAGSAGDNGLHPPLWSIIIMAVLLLVSAVSLCIVCLLSTKLYRQSSGKMVVSQSTELDTRAEASYNPQPYESVVFNQNQRNLNQPITIQNEEASLNINYEVKSDEDSPSGSGGEQQQRAQTFSFPPPNSRAPLPPEEARSGWQRSSSNPDMSPTREVPESSTVYGNQSSLTSALSVPDILIPEPLLYESPVNYIKPDSPKTSLSPMVVYIPPHPSSLPLMHVEGNAFTESVLDNEEREASHKSVLSHKAHSYVNVKPRATRLLSDPSGSKNCSEYTEPIPSNQRKQFYTGHRGAKVRLPPIGQKVGAAGKLSAHPPVRVKQRHADPGNDGSIIENSFRSKSQDHLELTTSLDRIMELEENGSLSLRRDKTPPAASNKEPQYYLEPVKY